MPFSYPGPMLVISKRSPLSEPRRSDLPLNRSIWDGVKRHKRSRWPSTRSLLLLFVRDVHHLFPVETFLLTNWSEICSTSELELMKLEWDWDNHLLFVHHSCCIYFHWHWSNRHQMDLLHQNSFSKPKPRGSSVIDRNTSSTLTWWSWPPDAK